MIRLSLQGGAVYQKTEQLDQRDYLTEAGGHYYTWVALTAVTVRTRSRNDPTILISMCPSRILTDLYPLLGTGSLPAVEPDFDS